MSYLFEQVQFGEFSKKSSDASNSIGNDKNVKTSSFYSQKKSWSSGLGSKKFCQVVLPTSSHTLLAGKKVNTFSRTELKSQEKSSVKQNKRARSIEKQFQNVFDQDCTVFCAKKVQKNDCKSNSLGITGSTSPRLKALSKKRPSVDTIDSVVSQPRFAKKRKFDINMNPINILDCDSQTGNNEKAVAAEELEVSKILAMKKSMDSSGEDTTSEHLSSEESKTEVEYNGIKTKLKKQKSLKLLCVHEMKSENTRKTHKEKDSSLQETCRILSESSQDSRVEKQSSDLSSSPVLFSPVSSSSGFCSSSSNSRTVSPEQQSSIMKYFSPVRREKLSSPVRSVNSSPDLGKKAKKHSRTSKNVSPSVSPVSSKKEQMFLDFGQKDFGHVTCCTCNMVYTRAQPEDEAAHIKFHQWFVTGLKFPGWKTERVLEHFDDGRVIVVLTQDHVTHLKKAADVRRVVDSELGFSSESSFRMQDAQTYLFITNKRVVGCVVAVDIQQAYPILPCAIKDQPKTAEMQGTWCCSSTPVRAQCGISRVWVLPSYRRKGIATRLLDCVRQHFLFGCIVSKDELAFSDPTPLGKSLAESYCATESFLVFR